jgi:hypothetical protein
MKRTRREQTKLHVYVDKEVRKKMKLIALQNNTSIQEILESYVMNFLHEHKGESLFV